MKTRTILLSIVLIFAIPAISSAQIGNVLKNKVGKAVNAGVKVLNKEADKKIDSAATKEAQGRVGAEVAEKLIEFARK